MIRSLPPNLATAPAIAPGDVVELVCTDLIAKTGQAVGRIDGLVVYVLGPVPGERARVRIESVKAKYAVGELVERLDSSSDRVQPFCRVFGECGGCQVQHLAYPAQLRWKRTIVENALRRIGGIEGARVADPVGMANPRAYRNKMALVVERAPAVSFGFYAARTHDVVPIETCPIVAPALDRTLAGLWQSARDASMSSAFGHVRHVVARTGLATGEGVVSLTTERADPEVAQTAPALAARLPDVVGIANSFDPPSENAVMGRKQRTVFGASEMTETIGDLRFRVSAASFFQVNSEMVGRIFAYLAPGVRADLRIIDLYCGAGTFALFFAKRAATVVGIEENPHAVREAKANATLNGVSDRATFLAGRVETTLRSSAGRAALGSADIVFLDPPRKGGDEATFETLARARVPHVWYLSCNPATLARDVSQLVRGGYRLGAVQPFDMFPQTGHLEVLAALHREGARPFAFAASAA